MLREKLPLRFRLRTFLACVAVLGLCVSWFAREYQISQREASLARQIRKEGGSVTLGRAPGLFSKLASSVLPGHLFHRIQVVSVESRVSAKRASQFADLPSLRHFYFSNGIEPDADMNWLAGLQSVTAAYIDEEALEHVIRIRGVRRWSMWTSRGGPTLRPGAFDDPAVESMQCLGSKVDLADIGRLKNLSELSIRNCNVVNWEGIAELAKLDTLLLVNVNFGDSELSLVRNLENLRLLLKDTQVSPANLERFNLQGFGARPTKDRKSDQPTQ